MATDLSARALAIAEEALFTEQRLRSLPPDAQVRYFEPQGERFRLRHEARSLVTFSQFNLSQAVPLPDHLRGMDVVFCRNVLIYFVPEAVRQAVDHLRAALRDGGYLFLGYAETLYGMSDGFAPVPFEDAYVHRRQATPAPAPPPRRPRRDGPVPAPGRMRTRPEHDEKEAPRPAVTSAELQRSIDSSVEAGDLASASQKADRWLSIEPHSVPARFMLARLYVAQDRDVEAAQLLRELLARDSLHAPSYVLLGTICSRQGEIDEAIAQFQHAIYLDPQTPLAYFFLGNMHQQQGQLRQALRAYRQALRLRGNFVPEWDSGFTPQLLVQICGRNIARLEQTETAPPGRLAE
jgi:chemotaxis protein methyltransferase CheR